MIEAKILEVSQQYMYALNQIELTLQLSPVCDDPDIIDKVAVILKAGKVRIEAVTDE